MAKQQGPPLTTPIIVVKDGQVVEIGKIIEPSWIRWLNSLSNWDGVVGSDLPPVYANNAAAVAGGLGVGEVYRTGGNPDLLCIVH